ncbi:MAG: HPr family phosphocarrier protein [Eubacterium sp.]|nr:HPr family phosphocarrier protein [Eubacterium sp.]
MVRAEITIANINGIHLDAANKVVNVAESFKSTIYLKTEYMDINAKSIINLVSGTLRYGDTVLCVCKGPDEKEALAAMKEILSNDLED